MKPKLLIVDDDEGIVDALSAMLETTGYTIETMNRGEDVHTLTREHLPDLILLDMLLSGVDGRQSRLVAASVADFRRAWRQRLSRDAKR